MQFTSVTRHSDYLFACQKRESGSNMMRPEGFPRTIEMDDICGWHVKFDNGWTLSAQWHKGCYANKDGSLVELAAYNEDDTAWWDFSRNKPVKPASYVEGHVKRTDIPKYMDQIRDIKRVEVYLNLERG